MSKKFYRRFMRAKTFEGWINRLKSFDYQLIKDNNLQMWSIQDYKNYWMKHKGAV